MTSNRLELNYETYYYEEGRLSPRYLGFQPIVLRKYGLNSGSFAAFQKIIIWNP